MFCEILRPREDLSISRQKQLSLSSVHCLVSDAPKSFYWKKTHSILAMCKLEFYVFVQTEKSLQDIIGDFVCPCGSVQNTCVSRSSHRKRLLKVVPNVCKAKHAATFWIFLLRTKKRHFCFLMVMAIFALLNRRALTAKIKNYLFLLKDFSPITFGHTQTYGKKHKCHSI